MIIIVYVIIAVAVGAIGVKWMHNEKPQHQLECTQKDVKKPDCKCEVLEAGKVIVK